MVVVCDDRAWEGMLGMILMVLLVLLMMQAALVMMVLVLLMHWEVGEYWMAVLR